MVPQKTVTALAVATGVLALAVVPTAHGTSSSSSLDLKGGNKLEANAWHCGTYVKSCSWKSSAKLLGTNPRRASWIQNNAVAKAHGPFAKLTIGKSTNVEITLKSKNLVKTRWRNSRAWISDSSGKVSPSFSTVYVSTESKAYANHKTFGSPGPVKAYAGAF